ncbi:MAG: hypothetical protein EPO21_14390 [Chloroflexota bacterium]|nr:MAG: hypothetical protein EPO21_14390 [Chloroflexota bacterium]
MVLSVVGLYLIFNQVQLSSGYWSWWGTNTFGLTLVPLIVGIGVLFFDGGSILGWALALAGVLIIVAGVLVNLHMYFRTTSLYDFLLMAGLFAAGLGLMARSLRAL